MLRGTVSQKIVASSFVEAFARPPTAETSEVCSPGWTFLDPLNIRCSNRWAKPVRPGRSSFEPT